MIRLHAIGLFVVLFACNNADRAETDTATPSDLAGAQTAGREITALAQANLLHAVGTAMAEQGAAYAVRYCNTEASGIADSLSRAHDCTISRITTRRRNPANRIESQNDKIAWNHFRNATPADNADTVLLEGTSTPVYYKPIFIASELCLQCHGSRSTEIALSTLNALDSLYPSDAAVNYRLGDLRGMWKVRW